MDLALTETQEMLRVASRKFLERECPTTLVRAMEGDERDRDKRETDGEPPSPPPV